MRFLLAAVNAKYIHSNLGVYSLAAYARNYRKERSDLRDAQILIGEYTINQRTDEILRDIFLRKPDVAGFSCYIWNIGYVREIVRNLKKVLPEVCIWLGGPEVSYNAEQVLSEEPAVSGIMIGEGERTFARLMECYEVTGGNESLYSRGGLSEISGLAFRNLPGQVTVTPCGEPMELDELPFPYEDLSDFAHRIIYYESSRGCPFRCSYCLSSIDKQVRFRSLELVKRELDFFLEKRVPQVKFVDRTFNCSRSHALEIWRYLTEHDNGVTNFHFEISADLIDGEQLAVMERMRPGLIQLEIGVQTTCEESVREIRRTMDLAKLRAAVARIKGFGTIHQHLDLIAGLPYEGLERFRQSFDDVFAMEPDQLQLGFLKILKGSYMAEMAGRYGMEFHEEPPYEVLSTRWLSYKELLELKAVEEMVEVYYNSGQFTLTLDRMKKEWDSAYEMFRQLADFYEKRGLGGVNHSRLSRYEILYRFLEERDRGEKTPGMERYRDLLMCDWYLRENAKSRPFFARDLRACRTRIRDFFRREKETPVYLQGYEAYDARQIGNMAHLELMGDGSMVLFDYLHRNPLNHNARAAHIKES